VTSLVLGKQPSPPPSNNARATFLGYALIVLAIQLLAFLNALRLLRRWRRQPSSRPHGWLRPTLRIVPPLVVSMIWSLACLKVFPFFLGAPLALLPLFVPDLGYTLLVSLAFALVWGVLKPILVILTLRTRRATAPTASADVSRRATA
jgi:hypothetical protein